MSFSSDVGSAIGSELHWDQFKCPFCTKFISLEAKVCPNCGRDIPAETVTKNKQTLNQRREARRKEEAQSNTVKGIIVAVIIAIVIIGGIIELIGEFT
ncbi:MAG: hypothetical protein IKR90_03965 [Clostridia bacterium]|nr:hypothetical protein [Clostridia bacterium]